MIIGGPPLGSMLEKTGCIRRAGRIRRVPMRARSGYPTLRVSSIRMRSALPIVSFMYDACLLELFLNISPGSRTFSESSRSGEHRPSGESRRCPEPIGYLLETTCDGMSAGIPLIPVSTMPLEGSSTSRPRAWWR